MNRMPMGELMGLVRELVGEMRGFREELREMKEVVEKGLRNVMKANHSWHQTHAGLCRVVGRVPTGGDGPGVSGVVVRGWDVLEVLEGEN